MMRPGSHIPPDLAAWLRTQPAEDAQALEQLWHAAAGASPDAPAPAARRVAALWRALDAATLPADAPDLALPDTDPLPDPLAAEWAAAAHSQPADAPAPDPGRIQALWTALDAAATPPADATSPRPRAADRAPATRRRAATHRFRLLGAAAAVVALLAAGLVLWMQQTTSVEAPHARRVALADGSQVDLDEGAVLRYSRAYGLRTRRVHLSGAAYFDVERDAAPFIVETPNARIQVRGTAFQVRTWATADGPRTTVTVAEGVVEVRAKGASAGIVVLRANQGNVVTGDAAPTPAAAAVVADSVAWRFQFAFYDATLGTIADAVADRFGVAIDVPAALRARRHTFVKQRADDVTVLLDDLSATTGLRYRTVGPDHYALSEP